MSFKMIDMDVDGIILRYCHDIENLINPILEPNIGNKVSVCFEDEGFTLTIFNPVHEVPSSAAPIKKAVDDLLIGAPEFWFPGFSAEISENYSPEVNYWRARAKVPMIYFMKFCAARGIFNHVTDMSEEVGRKIEEAKKGMTALNDAMSDFLPADTKITNVEISERLPRRQVTIELDSLVAKPISLMECFIQDLSDDEDLEGKVADALGLKPEWTSDSRVIINYHCGEPKQIQIIGGRNVTDFKVKVMELFNRAATPYDSGPERKNTWTDSDVNDEWRPTP